MEEVAGRKVERVIMIGDNPETDILGAVEIGWESVLLMTGVHKKRPFVAEPTFVAENLLEAVEKILGV